MTVAVPTFLRPPVALERSMWRLLGALSVVGLSTGYQGTVTTTSITYAAKEFGASTGAQGNALAIIRADIVVTLLIVRLADRHGRRRVLMTSALLAPVLTALCALSPSLAAFVVLQVIARGFVTAVAILAAIVGVEELPAGARAWASSGIVAAAALGSAMTLVVLPVAGLSVRGWRVLYVVPLLVIPVVRAIGKHIPESRSYVHLAEQRRDGKAEPRWTDHRRRLALILCWIILMAVFTNPARQFQNDFLRKERGFSAGGLSLFGLVTNVPGTLGILLGGRIADRRGRRVVVGVGLMGFAGAMAALFSSHGPALWVWSMVASVVGAATLPALAIYGPELFPTALRSRASGVITAGTRMGGAFGLVVVGHLGDNGHLGSTLRVLAISLVVAAVIVLTLVPETAGRELSELHQADR